MQSKNVAPKQTLLGETPAVGQLPKVISKYDCLSHHHQRLATQDACNVQYRSV